MRKFIFITVLFMAFAAGHSVGMAQDDIGITAKLAGGVVTAAGDAGITLQTKDGSIDVILATTTTYKRVSPDNPSLAAAVDSNLSEIATGDKILVTGKVSDDKKTIAAKAIYIITKSDIALRDSRENEEWRTRGISGKVVSVNPLSKEITITTRSVTGETQTVITLQDNIKFHRYALDSIKFSEAKQSNLAEIGPGDMIRALGDRGENNTFRAEEIITGAFQTTAGAITAVDVEKNEVTIMDIQTQKPVTVVISKNTLVKEFPAEIAQRLAMVQAMRASGAQPPGGGGQGTRPAGAGDGNRPGGGGGEGGGRRGGSIDEMLESFPTITVAELTIGKMIAVSSTKTANNSRVTAIKLLAGVEPFLTSPQGSGGRSGRGQGGQNINIPGLDDGGGINIP